MINQRQQRQIRRPGQPLNLLCLPDPIHTINSVLDITDPGILVSFTHNLGIYNGRNDCCRVKLLKIHTTSSKESKDDNPNNQTNSVTLCFGSRINGKDRGSLSRRSFRNYDLAYRPVRTTDSCVKVISAQPSILWFGITRMHVACKQWNRSLSR